MIFLYLVVKYSYDNSLMIYNIILIYYHFIITGIHYNKNAQKPMINEVIKEELRRNLSLEYEFYEFVKSRLYKQYMNLYT